MGLTLASARSADADTVVLDASRDNTLCEDGAGSLSNGAGEYLFAGVTDQPSMRRALIAFDIAGQIPPGSLIQSVTLRLNMSRTISGMERVTLYRVQADWGEGTSDAGGQEGRCASATPGDATWVHTFFDTDTWGTVGGDIAITPSASQDVGNLGPYAWGSTPEMVADVQAWLDNPGMNFGWAILGNELQTGSAKRFDSRQNASLNVRPSLTVDFLPGMSTINVYESSDPAMIVLPGNIVGSADVSPFDYATASPAAMLFYQMDDGSGSPDVIRVVKGGMGMLFHF
jgi:hypothetical protein